jgi:plasmid stabilization system protein ParE
VTASAGGDARIVLRPEAVAELQHAAAWYDERRDGLGDEFVAECDDALATIAAHPRLSPLVHGEIRRAVLRRFPYAIYRVDQACVVVLAVFHGHRSPDAGKSRS